MSRTDMGLLQVYELKCQMLMGGLEVKGGGHLEDQDFDI